MTEPRSRACDRPPAPGAERAIEEPGSNLRRKIVLRSARRQDYAFAERLYVETMQPLLSRLDAWHEDDVLDRFRRHYATGVVWMIRAGRRNVGFVQTSETEAEINLDQIHLIAEYRSCGIGSQLIRDLQREARARGKAVALSVIRHNPALALYQRLGFRIVDEDETKLHMRWKAGDASLHGASEPSPAS